jgi:hypothetical protein
MYKEMKIVLFFLFCCCCRSSVLAQTSQKIGENPFTLTRSAVFEVESVTKGFLPPRMTVSQRDDIYKPAKGLTIFNVSVNGLEVNAGSQDTPRWVACTFSELAITATRIAADYTVLSTDSTVLFDTTTKNLTATLPDATKLLGKIYYLRKDDSSTKTLAIAPQLMIQGAKSDLVLNYAKTIKVQSNGTDWVVID